MKEISKKSWIIASVISVSVVIFGVFIYFYINKPDVYNVSKHESTSDLYYIEYGDTFDESVIKAYVGKNKEIDYQDIKIEFESVNYGLVSTVLNSEQLNAINASEDKTKWVRENMTDFVTTRNVKVFDEKGKQEHVEIGSFSFSYIVLDTQAPVFSGVASFTITEGDEIDMLSLITASDPVDGAVEVTFTEFDGSVGTHTITATAKDRHENTTTQEIIIIVDEKPVYVAPPASSGRGSLGTSNGGSGNSNSAGSDWASEYESQRITINESIELGITVLYKNPTGSYSFRLPNGDSATASLSSGLVYFGSAPTIEEQQVIWAYVRSH